MLSYNHDCWLLPLLQLAAGGIIIAVGLQRWLGPSISRGRPLKRRGVAQSQPLAVVYCVCERAAA
jgi:hypothetical protein